MDDFPIYSSLVSVTNNCWFGLWRFLSVCCSMVLSWIMHGGWFICIVGLEASFLFLFSGNCYLRISMWSTCTSLTLTLLLLWPAILFQSGRVHPSSNPSIAMMKLYSMFVISIRNHWRSIGKIIIYYLLFCNLVIYYLGKTQTWDATHRPAFWI